MTTITWMGTNSFLLKTAQTAILIDPFMQFSNGEHPHKVHDFIQAGTPYDVRDILISHCHFDHLSSVPAILAHHPAIIYCTECGLRALKRVGCPTDTVVTITSGSKFDIKDVHIKVFKGRHIHFDKDLVLKTLTPSRIIAGKETILKTIYLLDKYRESHETIIYDIHVSNNLSEDQDLHIQFLGSLSLYQGEAYPTGADYLVLPYQGNTHLADIARDVIEHLQPKCLIASHFDNAFPPLSSSVDLSSLEDLVTHEFPWIKLIIPTPDKAYLLT